MYAYNCCREVAHGSRRPTGFGIRTTSVSGRTNFFQRCASLAGWILPGALLALLPKCPACLAAYIAIGTGVSLTTSTIGYLQVWLVGACVSFWTLLLARMIWRCLSIRD